MDTHINTKDAETEAKALNDSATGSMSTDDGLLQQLGHVSELRREFSSGLWDPSVFVSWGPGRHYPMWLQLRLPMVELLFCSITSLSPTAFKALDRLLTMAITISIISFVGTIAVASSLSKIALYILLQEVYEHLLPS